MALALLLVGLAVRLRLTEILRERDEVRGYAAIFDRPDRGGDVVRAGRVRGERWRGRRMCRCCGSTRRAR